MEVLVELTENESMEFASLIQAQLDLTRNRLTTLDVILKALQVVGITIIIPSMAPKNKVTKAFKENKDKLAIVLSKSQVNDINMMMDRGLPLTRNIPEVIELFVECCSVVGVILVIPGVTDVGEDGEKKEEREEVYSKDNFST